MFPFSDPPRRKWKISALRMVIAIEIELLEYLATQAGCMYLSDIRNEVNAALRSDLGMCVLRIAPQRCTPQEWAAAFAYITGEKTMFVGSGEIRGQLLEWLGRYSGNKERWL